MKLSQRHNNFTETVYFLWLSWPLLYSFLQNCYSDSDMIWPQLLKWIPVSFVGNMLTMFLLFLIIISVCNFPFKIHVLTILYLAVQWFCDFTLLSLFFSVYHSPFFRQYIAFIYRIVCPDYGGTALYRIALRWFSLFSWYFRFDQKY